MTNDLRTRLNASWRFFLAQGLVMILLGAFAIALPVFTTLALEIVIGWLLFIGGVWRAIHVLRANHGPGFGWGLAMAAVAMGLGIVLLLKPLPGIITFTMLLVALFVVDAAGKIFLALALRRHAKEWVWPFAGGITDLIFAALIIPGWPGSAASSIGLLVGLNMMFFGIALTVIAIAARRARHEDLQKMIIAEGTALSEASRPAQ